MRVGKRKATVKGEGGAEDTHSGWGITILFWNQWVERSPFVLSLQINGCGVCSNGAKQYLSICSGEIYSMGHSPMVGDRRTIMTSLCRSLSAVGAEIHG